MKINYFINSRYFNELDFENKALVIGMMLKKNLNINIVENIKGNIHNMTHCREFSENIKFVY